jgi:NADH:ubiquinone oxidoreductase subunit F (NADH-binding)
MAVALLLVMLIAGGEVVSDTLFDGRLLSEPAPFLAILHAVQDRLGWLPEFALQEIASALRMPLSEVFSAASFYHYFRLGPPAGPERHSCDGPACAKGAGGGGISCPGRCDLPEPRFENGRFEPFETPLPPPTGETEYLFRFIRDGKPGLDAYRARGGYSTRPVADPVERLRASGLSGRGGAGFPAASKWRAVREAPGEIKYVVCNADEGEPGTFKDRVLLDHDPHAILDGMRWAARTVGATCGILYLRYEYPQSLPVLERAIAEAREAGLLDGFPVHVRRGAGAYICGEETALLNSLEGKRPFPRERPPYPTTSGLFGRPTLVHNVETLAALPWILGRDTDVPTRLYSVSGDVVRPGVYELREGTPLRILVERHAGGSRLKAATKAGLSGGFLGGPELDGPAIPGGVIVYDETRCMVRAAATALRFFARESCGKCFPCRIGTVRLSERLVELPPAELAELCDVMAATSACGLGQSVPSIVRTLARRWPGELEAHRRGTCPAGECSG